MGGLEKGGTCVALVAILPQSSKASRADSTLEPSFSPSTSNAPIPTTVTTDTAPANIPELAEVQAVLAPYLGTLSTSPSGKRVSARGNGRKRRTPGISRQWSPSLRRRFSTLCLRGRLDRGWTLWGRRGRHPVIVPHDRPPSFQAWLGMTNKFVCEVYEIALARLPPTSREKVPSLARVGTLCCAVLIRHGIPLLTVGSLPRAVRAEEADPARLEELGVCDPMSEAKFSDLSCWLEAYGLDSPPPLERGRAPTPVEDVDEEEWKVKLAELREAGLLHD